MKKKAIIAIVSLIVFGQGVWAWDGSGTQGDPYQIKTIDDLNTLATNVNSGTTYEGVYFKLTANLDYSGETLTDGSNFTPIGCEDENPGTYDGDHPFCGIFDGGEKTISGITINQSGGFDIGLFGYILGATIKNLTLVNCSFSGNMYVGSIVGSTYSSPDNLIANCHVAADVYVNGIGEDNASIGGIVGYIDAGTVENCTCAATVTGNEEVGGISGWVYEGSLVDCTSNAIVSGRKAVGGIAGITEGSEDGSTGAKIYASITDCFYTGESSNVSGTSDYGIIVGEKGDYSTLTLTSLTSQLTLLDNDTGADINNANLLIYYNGAENVDVTLSGRTLYRDGGWNTICLPFNVSAEQMAATTHPLYGATIKQLDTEHWYDEEGNCYTENSEGRTQTGIEDGCLYLNFAEATSIVAGVPYIIKWGIASDHPDTNITNPEFTNVTINANASTEVSFTGGGSFVGTYNAKRFTTADLGQYLIMGGDNTLYYTKAGAGIGACRAYFQVPEGSASIKMFNLNFSDYSTTTKITNTNLTNQTYEDGEWWTLSGMKLNGKPSEKGVYLFNGKKVVIQ